MVPKRPTRTFSKRLVVVCVALAWAIMFYAVYSTQATVAVAGFTFIAGIGGAYMGVGHMDLRQLLSALRQGPDYGAAMQPDPPPIEMRDT